jgi:hypothetical protein
MSILMCQHGGLRVTRAAAGELEVGNVVGTYYAVEDIEDVIGNGLRFLPEVIVFNEVGVLTAYQAYGLQVW